MLVQAGKGPRRSAYVVVIGNEKGGSGKSTTAIHVAIALLKAGQRVATIDLDSRQKSLTHYIENRRAWATRKGLSLEIPANFVVERREGIRADENERAEFSEFAQMIASVEHNHDFVVIDTPGTDSYLMRLAHAMADTLITPLNDSFVDFDVLGTVDPATYTLTGVSHYAEMVRDARRQRRSVDHESTDWIVVRNRLSTLGSRNKRLIAEGLNDLGLQLGFRCAEGFAERVIYREFFPRGLTALDDIDESTLGTRPNLSHITARQEVNALLAALRLPIDEKGRRRAAARSEWFASLDRPVEIHDILD
ncbi:MAG: AAA family ATPase [Pseudorhodoplanes sp.]|nr:AAA family ATPase [Pseudorhodoplanes sp.]